MAARQARGNEGRRQALLQERNQAPSMRSAFPAIGHLRIDLHFTDRPPRMPSTQSFTLYPAASAFFRFACPCTDCDGEYNLTAAVTALAAGGGRKTTASAHLRCAGVRQRAQAGGHPCVTELDYRLSIGAAEAPE